MIEFETRRRPPPEINLSALIDITFILVIFIVLAATFSHVRVMQVDLPSADAPSTPEQTALVVTIPEHGPLRFDDTPVPLEEAKAALERFRSTHDSVLLVADRNAAIQRAVQVLSDAQQVGFSAVAIATQAPGGAPP